MRDRFVGDIGDYIKLAILRALDPGHQLGVVWWLTRDKGTEYLLNPTKWRGFDTEVFDALKTLVTNGQRSVRGLQETGLLPGSVFFSEPVPPGPARQSWFASAHAALQDCNLVFLDPDNGLEPEQKTSGSDARLYVALEELRSLRRTGRTIIFYQHQTRRKGGHVSEMSHFAQRLKGAGFCTVDAIRARPYAPRIFFILDASPAIRSQCRSSAENWRGLISWHTHPPACF